MKTNRPALFLLAWLAILAVCTPAPGLAQGIPIPGKKRVVREISPDTQGGGVTVEPKPQPLSRFVTHLVLSESRVWTSTDGKTLTGKLIAFEDLIAEAPKGSTTPPMPTPPPHPTVVRDGKIRLLIDQKTREVPLDRVSLTDQTLVEKIRSQRAAKAPATTP